MKKVLVGVVSLVALSILVSGCTLGAKDEKQSFIDATVKATCMVFQAENIFDPALETKAKDIYKEYGFDADDDAAMEAITKKYESDQEVQAAITKALEECAGDFAKNLETTTPPVEDTTTPPAVDTTAPAADAAL